MAQAVGIIVIISPAQDRMNNVQQSWDRVDTFVMGGWNTERHQIV